MAAVTGALALSALAVPAAQAENSAQGDTTVSDVVVNGGQPVVVNQTGFKRINVTMTVKDDSGVKSARLLFWDGTDLDNEEGDTVFDWVSAETPDGAMVCTPVNATTSTCKATYVMKYGATGYWKTAVRATGNDGDHVRNDNIRVLQVKEQPILRVNASPEPVAKGRTLTVTGSLVTSPGNGIRNAPVKLQYKKSGASGWATLKTVTSTSTGYLKTTTTATYDGHYRFVYAGSERYAPATATADYVDVR
jgi:hypothetical protein